MSSPNLTKHAVVLHWVEDNQRNRFVRNDCALRGPQLFTPTDEHTPPNAMGGPDRITVTVEPGDLLNEGPAL